jgi:hypothetical protein
MVATPQGREPGSRETSTVEAVTKQRLSTLICVRQSVKCIHELCECEINPITNPNPFYRHYNACQHEHALFP